MQVDAILGDWAIPVAVAVIALIGTLAATFLTHRRWKVERRSTYAEERRQVYRNIWDLAEGLNLQYRTGELSEETYRPALTALNAAMLKASPHLDEADRVLIRDYVQAVEDFLLLIARSGEDEARASVSLTGNVPADVASRLIALGTAQQRALDLRGRVVTRMRTIFEDV